MTVSNVTVYAPMQGSFGFLPESRWDRFAVSRIWTAMTERAKGYIQFLAVEETTTEIRAFILGVFHIAAADVTNYVATVNHIYELVGMKFTLHSVTSLNVANPDWLNINNQAWTERMRFSPSCSAAKGRSGKRNDSGPPTVSRSGRSAR